MNWVCDHDYGPDGHCVNCYERCDAKDMSAPLLLAVDSELRSLVEDLFGTTLRTPIWN